METIFLKNKMNTVFCYFFLSYTCLNNRRRILLVKMLTNTSKSLSVTNEPPAVCTHVLRMHTHTPDKNMSAGCTDRNCKEDGGPWEVQASPFPSETHPAVHAHIFKAVLRKVGSWVYCTGFQWIFIAFESAHF